MFERIDRFLNKITMYRLVLYSLIALILFTIPLSLFSKVPFTLLEFVMSAVPILSVSYFTNRLFAWAFETPVNSESVYISASILILLVTPATSRDPMAYVWFICWIAALTMASKFLFAIGKKHPFNPVALASVITPFTLGFALSWWVGNAYMAPLVAVAGFLIARKIKRTDLVASFLIMVFLVTIVSSVVSKGSFPEFGVFFQTLFQSPVLFLAAFMLTEPLTTPPSKWMRVVYGSIVGIFFFPNIHIGSVYLTPELALVLGNLFSYLVSPKERVVLTLQKKQLIAKDTYEFSFASDKPLPFLPGQYLEFTVGHEHPDSRGNRRYFTIASSPTEPDFKLGVKFYPNPSTFKNKLQYLSVGEKILAGQCAGEFVLPKKNEQKVVFIAGGIGITPFRSMIQYCLDTNDARDIIQLYSNRTVEDIAYKDVFDEASKTLGMKTLYFVTDPGQVASATDMRVGFIDRAAIVKEIPDYKERMFYLSGPHSMVTLFQKTLAEMGVPKKHIKCDFFPGFA